MKQSAGILAYRIRASLEVLLVHPGGPYFMNKDLGVWSIPKGEYGNEDPLETALKEFNEETGNTIESMEFIPLQDVRLKSGKRITAWAVACDFEKPFISSNTFEIEWPPKSGKKVSFPEVDKAEWVSLEIARQKLNAAQVSFLNQLEALLNNRISK